jgi:hypothetical protein
MHIRIHGLRPASATGNDGNRDTVIMMGSILDSRARIILFGQIRSKMRMQRGQVVLRTGINEFVDMEKRTCPESQRNSDNPN